MYYYSECDISVFMDIEIHLSRLTHCGVYSIQVYGFLKKETSASPLLFLIFSLIRCFHEVFILK
jgi:hypothetical protein